MHLDRTLNYRNDKGSHQDLPKDTNVQSQGQIYSFFGDPSASCTIFGVPKYLTQDIEDYQKDRRLYFETADGPSGRDVTARVTQGRILGPDFWNDVYDALLKIDLLPDATLDAQAKHELASITAWNTVEVELI